jgi:DUF1680 family protein
VLERTLYNGALSGVSLEGDLFFYQNPLASSGGYGRSPWFEVSCCPGNITRVLPSIPGYVYAVRDGHLYVNLFVESSADIRVKGRSVGVRQETRYPWSGDVRLTVRPEEEMAFTLEVRIPGWARGRPVPSDLYRYMADRGERICLSVNGQPHELGLVNGFARVRRTWRPGDRVELLLPMPVRRVLAHPEVEADRGRVALERGPLVYCFEEADNGPGISDLFVPDDLAFQVEERPGLLNGVAVIVGRRALAPEERAGGDSGEVSLIGIPYYAWAHRGKGRMAVWLRRQ